MCEEPAAVEPDVNLPLPAYLPESYVPDVHQRLVLYKRSSQVVGRRVADLRSECVDRFGEAPEELDALQEVMALKIELRCPRCARWTRDQGDWC